MKKALERPTLIIAAARYAYYYLSERESADEARWWLDQAARQSEIDTESAAERETDEAKGLLIKPELSADQLHDLVEKLQQYEELKHAWIAQKPMKHYVDVPAIAITVTAQGIFKNAAVVSDKISASLELDYTYYVVPKNGDFAKLAKAVINGGITK